MQKLAKLFIKFYRMLVKKKVFKPPFCQMSNHLTIKYVFEFCLLCLCGMVGRSNCKYKDHINFDKKMSKLFVKVCPTSQKNQRMHLLEVTWCSMWFLPVLPPVSIFSSLIFSSSGTLLSEPFLRDDRELRC